MRLKLTIAYDGRPYYGWATQPNSQTIEDKLNEALTTIAKQDVKVQGSGRTDTGVHADGQIAHFDCPVGLEMNPHNWVPALNTKLPKTIRVIDCVEVPADFHARFSATSKTYSYFLATTPVLHPMLNGRAWHLPRLLDPATLEQALQHYIGTHDFRAFAALRGNETAKTNYTRTITEATLTPVDGGYLISFTGDGFLYKMVRLLTGAAVQAAQGRLRLDDHLSLLDQPAKLPNGKSPFCAPGGGLTLTLVKYD
ncbi:MAG: tRNA pseudouridine(38-40) synthase TruA [Rubritalea sp.]|uniref:tRNA pseudouridine(38-40) synthase TruA n=1 Tax=Rubritalea sp. TaxID=2109375 RepID=UPI0032423355